MKKIISWTILTILLLITIINGVLLIKNKIYKEEVPDFIGYLPLIIETDSMSPVLDKYDFIIDKKIKSESDLQVGDIVSYKYGDEIITHRIAKIIVKDGKKKYALKANNSESYLSIITYADIKGVYVFKIPYLGSFIKYTRTPIGLGLSIILLTVPFIIFDIIIRLIRIYKNDKLKMELIQSIKEQEELKLNKMKRNK